MQKILIVEDNPSVAHSIYDIFETMGYDVRLAHEGGAGWQHVQSDIPDVIISDIEMPGMDGYEFLRQIRACDKTQTTPFIFLTARAERDHMRHGMTLGADDFITKPFTAKDIVASVESVLNKHQKINNKHQTTLSLLRKNISYTLPHELRTPLMAIMGYAELLGMDADTLSRQEIKLMSDMIIKGGQRLQRLIENTVAFAQLEIIAFDEKGQEQLRNHLLPNVGSHIRVCAEELAEKWQRSNDLRLKLEDGVIRMSVENLKRIMEELVDNAFKFSDRSSPITIRTMQRDDCYMIVVHDKGRGMSREQLENIGPYIQFERALYEQQGAGLGLAIAKRLVELHQGAFHIRSMPGEGTLVTIKLVR